MCVGATVLMMFFMVISRMMMLLDIAIRFAGVIMGRIAAIFATIVEVGRVCTIFVRTPHAAHEAACSVFLCVVVVGLVRIFVRAIVRNDSRAIGVVCVLMGMLGGSDFGTAVMIRVRQGGLNLGEGVESAVIQPKKIRSRRVGKDRIFGCTARPDEYDTQRGSIGDNVILVLDACQCVVNHLIGQPGESEGNGSIFGRISSAVPL